MDLVSYIFFSELVNVELKTTTLFWVRFMYNNDETFHWTKGTRWAELHDALPVVFLNFLSSPGDFSANGVVRVRALEHSFLVNIEKQMYVGRTHISHIELWYKNRV